MHLMPYAIHIPVGPAALLESLPSRGRSALQLRLARLAEAAEAWPVGDARWGQLARPQGGELLFYAEGCCVRLRLEPRQRRLVVHEVGRVLVNLTGRHCEGQSARPGLASSIS